ncbi:hypothetical protein [Flagellimonas zhangzhouensis]|uniref:Uncharacterized protein n=1 Tax=Flagellimonas zhangzhouensis TaxID=1073328 RepID=A0A1H2WX11_9FLAO|nr:hypothetical protein [Allomuricauda zhangzhouensis]SDQ25664.1 hypothetical protein SAMN05216294_1099 [Allomuricauda zhangzhouensis]SDW85077.1 hypothetical protein SAMN04487892_2479 [Allomuricauda zhangzhouensis]
MTKYYSSSSYFIFEAIFASIILCLIGYGLFSATTSIFLKTTTICFTLLILVSIALYLRNIVFSIFFEETEIIIDFHLKKQKTRIQYSDLVEIKYISVQKAPDMNRIYFKTNKSRKSKKFQAVSINDEFVEFYNWLKTKNPKIKVSLTPPDHYLNELLFGPKYRKFIKKTL